MFTLSVCPVRLSANTTTPSPDHLESSGFRHMIGMDVWMGQLLSDFRPRPHSKDTAPKRLFLSLFFIFSTRILIFHLIYPPNITKLRQNTPTYLKIPQNIPKYLKYPNFDRQYPQDHF